MLLTLSASELASDKARAENEKIRLAALEESVRGQTTQARTRAHPPAASVGGTTPPRARRPPDSGVKAVRAGAQNG